MRKAPVVAGVALLALAGCSEGQPATWADLTGVPAATPTAIEAYTNIDQHPNIVRLCIDGRGFVTTTRKRKPWERAEYFDQWCGTPAKETP